MTSGGALLVALLLQGAAGGAGAAPEPAPTSTKARLELRGAVDDCTSRDDLAARVAARSPRIQFVDDAAIDARVDVTSAHPGNVVADLLLAAPGVEQPPRRVVARSCAEAADAIALIIAVTLDPTRALSPAPPPAPVETVKAPPPPAPPATTRRELGVFVAGQTIFGPAPVVMPGVTLSVMAALDRAGPWAPALYLGATHVWRDGVGEQNGTASFTLDAASLDACPLRFRRGHFAARPCASVLFGRMTARGSDTGQAASAARPFAVAGAAVVASFGSTVEVDARIAVGATLLRDSYEFATDVFYQAGHVTTSASLGVGAHF